MSKIYIQHEAAFSNVSAYVITDKAGERVATLAFKFPRDGAGRLWCYLHVLGLPMQRGSAGGYGYDKRSAASCEAARKIEKYSPEDCAKYKVDNKVRDAIVEALDHYGGETFDTRIRNAGFNILQAV
jgi:hypothetical protein